MKKITSLNIFNSLNLAFKAHQGNFRKNSELLKTMYML